MALTAGTKLGPYEVKSLLGAGGMGEVYRARDPRLGRDVAIKVLPAARMADENRRSRFVQEARAASALNHPNIVTIYEIDSADGIDFIVMEFVPGKSLDALIPRQGMRVPEVLRIAIPMADALARAHARGIVHRDLKPANIAVSDEGVVKVLDFGLAKLVASDEGSDDQETVTRDTAQRPLSHPGAVAGTAGYMSPEQATAGKVDSRSDVFSFGAVLYEMVTGRRAFAGSTTAETLLAVVREQPKAPSELVAGVPKELDRLILRCLRKEPDRRFQHMVDVKVELNEIKEESDSGPAAAVPARRSRVWWLPAVLSGALAIAAGVWHFLRSPRTDMPPPTVVPLTFTPGVEWAPSFSPDGEQLAFLWQGEKGGNWDVYIKMIGSTDVRRLTTDPAEDGPPSWSPDGRQIAFIRTRPGEASGSIYLTSPLGGSERKLSNYEAPAHVGDLSWSPDGRWLATAANVGASEAARGISLIAVPGGEARSITSPKAPTYHTSASISPDGHYVAYEACRLGIACHLEVLELGSDYRPKGAPRRLTRRVIWRLGGLAWTRDGRSVVYSDGSTARLWRAGISGEKPPEPIEAVGLGAWSVAIARSRDRLAFVRSPGYGDIWRFAEGHPAEVVAASSASDQGPHFSPDGQSIAWASGRAGQGDEIWRAAADGSHPVQLTHGPGIWQGSPRWSPDGQRIAFDSMNEDGYWHIFSVDVDGGSLRRLTQDDADENLPSWSKDGRYIYFTSNRAGAQDVWRAAAQGGPAERVTPAGGFLAYESADGKTLFFTKSYDPSPLFALPLTGGGERKLIDCVALFTVGREGVYHLGCGTDKSRVPLSLLDPGTGRDRLLGTLEKADGPLAVSPDGKTILYTKDITGESSDLMMIENFR